MLRIIPTRNKVLVERVEVERFEMGGMVVPDTVRVKIPPCEGVVVRVGDGVEGIDEGDVVVYGVGAGIEVGRGLVVLRVSQVVCRKVGDGRIREA